MAILSLRANIPATGFQSEFVFSLCLGYHSFVLSGFSLGCLYQFSASPFSPLFGIRFLRYVHALACQSASVQGKTQEDLKQVKRKSPVSSHGTQRQSCCCSWLFPLSLAPPDPQGLALTREVKSCPTPYHFWETKSWQCPLGEFKAQMSCASLSLAWEPVTAS